MSYRLRLNPAGSSGTEFVSLATGITGNLGTQNYSYRIKGILNAMPTVAGNTGAFAFIGSAGNAQSNGICVYSTGAVNVLSGGTLRYGTLAGFLSAGEPFDFTVNHVNTGAWTITNNITSTVVASGTYTASTSWSASLNNIGRLNSSTTHYLNADIELIEVTGQHTNGRVWDANLSNGTGTILPTTVGTNQGTLTNFGGATDSWWIYYSDVEEHFGTFTAAASIARALSSEKQGLGLYTSSMFVNSSWAVTHASTGGFSATYSITRSLTSSKEVSLTKPNQSLVAGKTFTQSKEVSVSKPNQSLFTGTSLTQSKQAIVNKPTQSLLAAIGFTQAKEVNVAKPTTLLHENSAFTWEIFYGVGGTFASVMQLTKTLASNKESSSTLSGSLLATGSVNSSKEIATAFNSGMQTGFSGISSEKQTLANIYAEMVSGFSITSSKESGSYFARTMRIDDRFSGGTDEAGRPRVITYSTNVLSKRSYQTSATITRIV